MESKTQPQPSIPKKLNFGIPYLTGAEIRQSFVDFFKSQAHLFVPSAAVVPHDDPTLLFTNAGMNQFKAALLGDNKEGYKRVANSQKCIRVSGKHNDLDEVGRDTYHHTFFEMLGNWSFGDYYKQEAISWAWKLLTEVWKLPKNRLFVSVYKTDDEAEGLWKSETDIDPERILRFGEKENFWEMGEIGPCGPCSEIHFDMGDLATQKETFRDAVEGVNGSNARYIEIWNLVFMQFERLSTGDLKPLKNKNVDTGMGFERIASIIQSTGTNYETDVFSPLIRKITELSGIAYDPGEKGTPHRVIADHLRALSFAIADGATPGNEGRGYVLRRILRRASRFARTLEQKEPFICRLVGTLAEVMGDAFPEIRQRQSYVEQVIRAEEERFMRTLDQGLERFGKIARDLKAKNGTTLAGADIFTLYDTYGFPVDLTGVLAEEQGLTLDLQGYQAFMEEQRERARGATKFDNSFASDEGWTLLSPSKETTFIGYDRLEAPARVLRYRESGDFLYVVLAETPFYAESGGQVGDTGFIEGPALKLRVLDTVKVFDMIVHKCTLAEGFLPPSGTAAGPETAAAFRELHSRVDGEAREATFRNHSATHLLHAALREVLGSHVQQQGSRVSPEGLRFDFTHHQAVSAEELALVEAIVNRQIQGNLPITHEVKPLEEAKALGAMALFGEKYGEKVRVIRMGDYSMELCGGTHATATGQLGIFKVTGESSIASGVRRIEAVTGAGAFGLLQRHFLALGEIGRLLKAKPGEELAKVQDLAQKVRGLEKELEETRGAQARQKAEAFIAQKGKKEGESLRLVASLTGEARDKEEAARLVDGIADRIQGMKRGAAVLTFAFEGNLSLVALCSKEVQGRLKAGDLVKELAALVGGKGGGRPDRAQAGSRAVEKEGEVLRAAEALLEKSLV